MITADAGRFADVINGKKFAIIEAFGLHVCTGLGASQHRKRPGAACGATQDEWTTGPGLES